MSQPLETKGGGGGACGGGFSSSFFSTAFAFCGGGFFFVASCFFFAGCFLEGLATGFFVPDDGFFVLGGIAVREWAASAARSGTLSEAEPAGFRDALPRTLVAQDRTVLERAREYSVHESRSAIRDKAATQN